MSHAPARSAPLASEAVEPARIRRALRRAPFADRARVLNLGHALDAVPLDYAVAMPVRNEAARLPDALEALARAMHGHPGRGAVVCVVNDTDDDSGDLFRAWVRREGLAFVLLEATFAEPVRNAPCARRLALDIACELSPLGALFTTDADCRVGPHWVSAGVQRLQSGFGLVCEDVRLDPTELDSLPEHVQHADRLQRTYRCMLDGLWRYWTGGRAGSFGTCASGSSMAISAPVYRRVGGLPTPRSGEDRALWEGVRALGVPVAEIANGGTVTSARLTARAAIGCGATLLARASAPDPECDEWLAPVSVVRRLARAVSATVSEAGLNPAVARPGPRAASGEVPRMRVSELRQEVMTAERELLKLGLPLPRGASDAV